MMYEPEYMEAFDVMALADDGRDCQPPAVACDACTDTTPRLTLDEAIAEFLRAGATEPVAEPLRTADDSAEVDSPRPIAVAHEGRPASPPGGTSADREPSVQPTSREGLLRRAISMFCNGRQNMVVHSSAADVSDVTFDLIASVKAVVTAVFKDHAESLCSSPERPDLRLSQEEAMGHLVGSLFVGEVLVEEARPLGKRLDFHAGKEAKAEAAGKESVRHQKKAVRRKKGLSSDEQQRACDDIDRIAAEARVEHLAQTVDLSAVAPQQAVRHRQASRAQIDHALPGMHAHPSQCRRGALAAPGALRQAVPVRLGDRSAARGSAADVERGGRARARRVGQVVPLPGGRDGHCHRRPAGEPVHVARRGWRSHGLRPRQWLCAHPKANHPAANRLADAAV